MSKRRTQRTLSNDAEISPDALLQMLNPNHRQKLSLNNLVIYNQQALIRKVPANFQKQFESEIKNYIFTYKTFEISEEMLFRILQNLQKFQKPTRIRRLSQQDRQHAIQRIQQYYMLEVPQSSKAYRRPLGLNNTIEMFTAISSPEKNRKVHRRNLSDYPPNMGGTFSCVEDLHSPLELHYRHSSIILRKRPSSYAELLKCVMKVVPGVQNLNDIVLEYDSYDGARSIVNDVTLQEAYKLSSKVKLVVGVKLSVGCTPIELRI